METLKEAENCLNLQEIREGIDWIDSRIVELIARRSQYVMEAAKFKKDEEAVKDAGRVEKVIQSKKELAEQYGASPELIEKIYRMMIDFFINEEMKKWKKN